jgi:hypothetical protein
LRSYALFRLRKRKFGRFGRFRSGDPFLCSRREAAQNWSFILEVHIKIQIHVSIKFTPGIDLYVCVFFFCETQQYRSIFLFSANANGVFCRFYGLRLGEQNLATGWAIWTTGWAFAHPVNMLEEALPCVA